MGLTGFVDSSSIKPGHCTDHSMISMSLSLHNNPHGCGFWKFNGSLLQNTNYVTLVKKVIDETMVIIKKSMAQLLWDTVKDQIRGSTIKYSSTKKKKGMEKLKKLEILLAQLEEQRDLNDNTTINSSIRNTKQEKDKIME